MPQTAVTKIAVDSKYWLYINGVLAVFEGGIKRGPTKNSIYYDATQDIGKWYAMDYDTSLWDKADIICSANEGVYGIISQCATLLWTAPTGSACSGGVM